MIEEHRREEHKELFRLWYECVIRTSIFWESYHVFVKNMIYRNDKASCAQVKYALEVMPNNIIDFDDEVDFVKSRCFFIIGNKSCFVAAQEMGFDRAWESYFKGYCRSRQYRDVEDLRNIISDSVDDHVANLTMFTGYQDDPEGHATLKHTKNHQKGLCVYGQDWWSLTGFDVGHDSLSDFIASLPIFSEDSMRINISIAPFGKTKKEILDEVWNIVSRFKNDKTKSKRHIDRHTQWFSPYGKFRPDEIKRYLGVFDLRAMNKSYKEILRGDYEDFDCDLIQEVRRFYTGRVQSEFDDTSKEAHRMLARDYAKAEALITNALAGYFPKYPED